jgi:hypothetical protein
MNPSAIREMLLQVEATPAGSPLYRFKIDDLNELEILEHVQLLLDAGFVDGKVVREGMGTPSRAIVKRMTLAGHQFLANARNDTIWKKVVAFAKEKGLATSITVIAALLEAEAKKHMGLH